MEKPLIEPALQALPKVGLSIKVIIMGNIEIFSGNGRKIPKMQIFLIKFDILVFTILLLWKL